MLKVLGLQISVDSKRDFFFGLVGGLLLAVASFTMLYRLDNTFIPKVKYLEDRLSATNELLAESLVEEEKFKFTN